MKNKFSVVFDLLLLAVGVLFVVLWANGKGVFDLVSIVVGIVIIVFSSWLSVALIAKFKDGLIQRGGLIGAGIPLVCSLALGIAMVAASQVFVGIFSYLSATLLIVGALYKFWEIFSVRKTVVLPFWVFIMPAIVMVCGIVLFAIGIQIVQQWLALIVGVAFIIYALHSIVELVLYKRLKSQSNKRNATDVKFDELPDKD